MNVNALFFDPGRHCEALALLAGGHLNQGEFALAFQYADRRCRQSNPGAHDYLLRAEASRRAGHEDVAALDLARAMEIDPTDRLVNHIALLWGAPEQKLAAARALVADETSGVDALRHAVALLFENGARTLFGLRRQGEMTAGWVAWAGAAPMILRVQAAGTQDCRIAPDSQHALAGANLSCGDIAVEDNDRALRRLDFLLDGILVESFSPPTPLRQRHIARHALAPHSSADAGPLSIIVPVYEDFEATRACLDALFAGGSEGARLIVVDDASPNPRLRAYLDQQAAARKFLLIRNEVNLGFAASVNKALAQCSSGDIVLLNADTLPPPSSIGRLAAVARSAPGIGTVTPLSNNGEITSFPTPNVANPLGSPEEVARLDALAHRANGAAAVDLPNGIGFCLYVTRACLDAVGPLPEIYARGYFEDVEFCLRAREQGFRNVCAVGVYVGHAGARSFGAEKKRLVMRNLAKLESRFPSHSLEAAAFDHADPLKTFRGAIEALAPIEREAALLVCGEGASGFLAREEAQRRTNVEGEAAPLICACTLAGDRVFLRGPNEAPPQSLSFSLRNATGIAALRAYLGATKLRRIEIFDPLSLPDALLTALSALDLPVELVCADLEWVFSLRLPKDGACLGPEAPGPCPSCSGALAPSAKDEISARRLERWRSILSRADSIRPLDSMSDVFARNVFGADLVSEWISPRVLDAPAAPPIVQPLKRKTPGDAL
ncbi:glycosyltransferase family 2 protein, partial [Rhodoblastus sp.]|uniref:glycosyltransferase family 2 protein n=1 Tax=Rhodoblastus sp. TaxID=1962975 RepID=UPI003F9BC024